MLKPAPVQLFQNQRYLLAGAHQQGAQADRVCFFLDCAGHDCFNRHLFSEVNHLIAIVGQDGFNQVLADIMDVTIYGRQEPACLSLRLPFTARYLSR